MKLLIAIVVLAGAVDAQSLGEVARQTRQKRAKAKQARAPITDETLPRRSQSVEATLQRLYREFKETVPQPATDHAHAFWIQVLRPENRALPEEWVRLHSEAAKDMAAGCAANPRFTLPDSNQKALEDVYNLHSDRLRDLGKRYQQMLAAKASEAEMKKSSTTLSPPISRPGRCFMNGRG